MKWLTELLHAKHDRAGFSCGKPALDNYFHRQAGQDVKRKLSACFVWEDAESGLVKGYYTLSNSGVDPQFIPDSFRKKLPPSYTSLPTTLLGRLAVDMRFQGSGAGQLLLIDALRRSCEASHSIGSYAVAVDPLDQDAAKFYGKFGFITLPDSGKMFLPMRTIGELFQ
jgi:hypothetical protein